MLEVACYGLIGAVDVGRQVAVSGKLGGKVSDIISITLHSVELS